MADMERELGHNSANQECVDPVSSHSLAVPAELFTVKPRELSIGDKLIEEEYKCVCLFNLEFEYNFK